jgi:hypothetical protein
MKCPYCGSTSYKVHNGFTEGLGLFILFAILTVFPALNILSKICMGLIVLMFFVSIINGTSMIQYECLNCQRRYRHAK